jgi:hypothetical protein
MNHRAFRRGPVRRAILLVTIGVYLFGPYYSFREMPGNCTCGCGESAERSCCRLKDPGQGEGSLVPGRCCCCAGPGPGRKISGRCSCRAAEESNLEFLEVIVPKIERVGLLYEIGHVSNFDERLLLPGYKIPPLKPLPGPHPRMQES